MQGLVSRKDLLRSNYFFTYLWLKLGITPSLFIDYGYSNWTYGSYIFVTQQF